MRADGGIRNGDHLSGKLKWGACAAAHAFRGSCFCANGYPTGNATLVLGESCASIKSVRAYTIIAALDWRWTHSPGIESARPDIERNLVA
jgi:hypothetical protein